MGNWHISIEGCGSHHNGLETDAEQIAARALLEDLIAAGHSITHASFTSGGAIDLKNPNGNLLPIKGASES